MSMRAAALEAETSTMPDTTVSVGKVFGIDSEMEVPAFSERSSHVPDVDEDYLFNREVTLAILAG
ncbi:MAG: cobaltochelatase subunit CobS, partial [Pseudomonadota bacterium]